MTMTMNDSLRLIAGFFVLLSVALGLLRQSLVVLVHGVCRAESGAVGFYQMVPDDGAAQENGPQIEDDGV